MTFIIIILILLLFSITLAVDMSLRMFYKQCKNPCSLSSCFPKEKSVLLEFMSKVPLYCQPYFASFIAWASQCHRPMSLPIEIKY